MRYTSYYSLAQVHSKRRPMQANSSATISNNLIIIYQAFLVLKFSNNAVSYFKRGAERLLYQVILEHSNDVFPPKSSKSTKNIMW